MILNPKRKGKIGELIAIRKLTELGFDVYDNIVDDRGIDLIVRNEKKGTINHKDIQVKFSKFYDKFDLYWFGISKSTFSPSEKLYILFVLDENRIFVIPSSELFRILKNVRTDKKGNWKITITLKDNWVIRCRKKASVNIEKYLNNFSQLRK
ncbi:MAG: hypothetical protein COV00_03540 [Candidatus Tagabacteria bacterium CG10_big_fil_rev_8_21_14_0_10_40_13]|uniref:Endonuclease n=1 Tax=Candidatus Tagabacteria bacterium CG10_big_fil_rev_8_21_14_0_10_40_13 TaxID=1975022 RepID=A0A2M8L852_9BACT|nr:MAG: hypothetical protein COV00_03540 [Candidatus Tagabacteria bacterium CG10_big_fil_rev_8_21_14_0_10_40_13]